MLNNFGIDYETGISISGKKGNFACYTGVYNNDVGDPGSEAEFGDPGGGFSYVASASYDMKASLGVDKAVLRGDLAGYPGVNYYLYGHKLKFMTGVEFSLMDGGSDGGDYDGVTALAGVRIYW